MRKVHRLCIFRTSQKHSSPHKPSLEGGHLMIHVPGNEMEAWMWFYQVCILLSTTMLSFGFFWMDARENGGQIMRDMPTWLSFPLILSGIAGIFVAFPITGLAVMMIPVSIMIGTGAPTGAVVMVTIFHIFCWFTLGHCLNSNQLQRSVSTDNL